MTYDTINDDVTMGGGAQGTLLAGRYRAVRQLGQGGMGSVWLAEDTQLDNRPVAIKMLPSILVANKRAYAQLKAEALVSLKLSHSNIVTLRAFEENSGNPFLVMDYVEGQTLDDYLGEWGTGNGESAFAKAMADKRGTDGTQGLPEADVIRILTPVAAALDYAHGEGVVHRDVKPANVMIRKRDGHPFVLDFGIAREAQESMTRVTGQSASGTLTYMSPEQLRGSAPAKGQDIYSFAAMAYECLAGHPPFWRGAIEDQIKNEPPPPLPSATPFATAVMRGLMKRPEDRPASCLDIVSGESAAVVETRKAVPYDVPDVPPPAPREGVDISRSDPPRRGELAEEISVTIYGYREWYLFPPAVSVYHNGVCIGKVGRNEKIVVKVPRGDRLTFKMAWGRAGIQVDAPVIILSTNRVTGQISARSVTG